MTAPSFLAVKAALEQAAALHGEPRRTWLLELGQRDPAVHAEVVALLDYEADETPLQAVDAAARSAIGPPTAVGPYQVLGVLGEGGMGVVLRALQTEPLRREVAVKVLWTPIVTPTAAARFRAEARALARLDHPHVAIVYDAGVDGSGRPYLAMQLVDGVPITTACEGRPLADRLGMFLDVCDAVRHAHQRGIVHRDLKPSNLLVGRREGRDWPVVIDFGIALDEERDATVTSAGQVLGTPAYMSPEQAGAFGGIVDTRTDVYALGVVLFEMLTGSRPRTPTSTRPEELRRTLTTDAPRASAVLAEGPITPRQLRGDIDTILRMALRPEPDRRYGSVEALAEDLRRAMDGRPVLARGDDAAYRLGRFVHRHRAGVAIAAALLAIAGAAVAVGVVQDLRVRAQRDRAVLAEQVARDEAATARRAREFLVEMFAEANPENTGGETVTARDLLDRGAAQIGETLEDDLVVRATLLAALAQSYLGLGEHERASMLADEALALRDTEDPRNVPATIEILRLCSNIRHDQGRLDEALASERRALDLARSLGEVALVAPCANELAVTLDALGRYDEAEPLYREALAGWRSLGGNAHPDVPWGLNTLGQVRFRLGHYREAERLFTEAGALADEVLGEQDLDRAAILNNLGGARYALGDYAGAETTWREALLRYQTVYGPTHAAVGRGLRNLGSAREARGARDEALGLYEEALRTQAAALGEHHNYTAGARASRGRLRIDQGDLAGARTDLEQALADLVDSKGPDHPETLGIRLALGDLAEAEGRAAEAQHIYAQVWDAERAALGEDHPRTAGSRLSLGRALRQSGDCSGAVPVLDEALRVALPELGPEHPVAVWAEGERALCGVRNADGADPVAEARAMLLARYGAGHRYLSGYSP